MIKNTVLVYNIQNRNSKRKAKMSPSRTLKQLIFKLILQINLKLSQISIFQRINTILDYLVLIIASITIEDKHFKQQIPFLKQINQVVMNREIMVAFGYMMFGLSIGMVLGCGIVLGRNRFGRGKQDNIRKALIKATAWMSVGYEMLMGINMLLIAKNSDFIFYLPTAGFLNLFNIFFSTFYCLLFTQTKFFHKYFTLFFIFQIFFTQIISVIFIIIISSYLLNTPNIKQIKFIYVQIIFLKVLQLFSLSLQIDLQITYLRTVLGFLVLFPIISYLYYYNTLCETTEGYQSEYILNIGLKLKEKSLAELQNRQVLVLRFFFSQSNKGQELQPSKQTFYDIFCERMDQQILKNPKNIKGYIHKIRLSYESNKSMLKVLHQLQTLNMFQTSKLHQQFQIYSFTNQMINKYKIQNTSNIHQVQENDERVESNQLKVLMLLKELIDLWQYLKNRAIDEKIIMKILAKIDKYRKQIYSNIEFFANSEMNNHLLINQYAIKCLYPQYEVKKIQQQDKQYQLPIVQKAASYYILLVNGKVDCISFNLTKKLGLDPFFIKNLTKQNIFPSFLRNQEQISLQNMGKQGQMPIILINSESNIELFKGKTSIFHNMGERLCYFLHLEEIDQQNQPYLMINTTINSIAYKSANFDKYFLNLGQTENMDIDALFCNGFSSFKASQQIIVYSQIRLSKREKKILKIEKISTFSSRDMNYLLIKIYATKNIIKNSKLNLFIEHSISKKTENKWQIHQKQFFFCRIPHPFEIKYNEVLQHIQDGQRIKTKNIITIMFIATLAVILSCFISTKVILYVKDQEFLAIVDQIGIINEAKNNIILLFEQSYKLFYLRSNDVTFLTSYFQSNKTIDQVYIGLINNLINQLQNFKFKYHKEIISFVSTRYYQMFQISSDISSTSAILDILQITKKFLIDNNLLFLFQNFNFISQFQQSLQIQNLLTEKILEVQQLIRYSFIGCIVLVNIILILTYVYMYKSCNQGRQIIKMIMNYPRSMIDSTLQTLENFQTYIINNQSVYYSKNQPHQEQSVNELVVLVEKQRLKEVKSEEQLRKKDIEYLQHPFLQISEKINEYLFNIAEKNIVYEGEIMFLIKNYYFLITIIAVSIYFIRFQSVNTQNSLDKLNIMSYLEEPYEIKRNILSQSIAVYQKALQQYYNISDSLNHRPTRVVTRLQQDLPDYFQQYVRQQNNQFRDNLCQGNLSISSEFYFKKDDCMKAVMGGLSKGISIGYSSYTNQIDTTFKQIGLEQSQFITNKQHAQQFSFLDLAERLMSKRVQLLKKTYKQKVTQFVGMELFSRMLIIILQEIFIIIAISVGWYFGIIEHQNRCKLIVNSFKMLRKDYILSKFMLKYCKKNEIFQKLAKL